MDSHLKNFLYQSIPICGDNRPCDAWVVDHLKTNQQGTIGGNKNGG